MAFDRCAYDYIWIPEVMDNWTNESANLPPKPIYLGGATWPWRSSLKALASFDLSLVVRRALDLDFGWVLYMCPHIVSTVSTVAFSRRLRVREKVSSESETTWASWKTRVQTLHPLSTHIQFCYVIFSPGLLPNTHASGHFAQAVFTRGSSSRHNIHWYFPHSTNHQSPAQKGGVATFAEKPWPIASSDMVQIRVLTSPWRYLMWRLEESFSLRPHNWNGSSESYNMKACNENPHFRE